MLSTSSKQLESLFKGLRARGAEEACSRALGPGERLYGQTGLSGPLSNHLIC